MKKLYLSITLFFMFILMVAITMIPTHAYTYNDPVSNLNINIETAIPVLNNYSLREVYSEYNEGVDLSTWTSNTSTITISNDTFILNPIDNSSNVFARGVLINRPIYHGLSIYVNARVNILGDFNYAGFYSSYTNTGAPDNATNLYFNFEPGLVTSISTKNTFLNTDTYFSNNSHIHALFQINYSGIPTPYQNALIVYTNDIVVLDLNSLGLENVSKELLDYYYSLYLILVNGINPSVFYDQGYDEGEDFGYLDGYNDGLVEGYYDGNSAYHQGTYEFDYLTGVPYLEGLETGYNNGVDYAVQENISILSIFELIFGVALNMLTFIITIDIFGISILSLISVLSLFVGVVWILKMIRG